MADGIAITAGSGTTILTDDTGAGGHAQIVKLGIATDASAVLIPSDATSGLLVSASSKSLTHGAAITPVTSGDRVSPVSNVHGIPFQIGGHPVTKTIRLQFTAAQTNTAIITVATGLKIVVTALQVTLDNASTVFPSVRIGFGTASTPTTTGVIAAHGGVPAGGGFSRGDGSGILGIGADDEDLRITTVGAATGNGVEVIVTYYEIEA